jgi:hypothetical protein
MAWASDMLFSRPAFALLSQASLADVFRFHRRDAPWRAAEAWWTVYGSLGDVGCLIALVRLAKGERAPIADDVGLTEPHNAQSSRAIGNFLAHASGPPTAAFRKFEASNLQNLNEMRFEHRLHFRLSGK